MREASSLSVAARHSLQWGEAKASQADLEVELHRQSVLAFWVCLEGAFECPFQEAKKGGGLNAAIGVMSLSVRSCYPYVTTSSSSLVWMPVT
jgi:hypothetical protein